MEWLELHIDTNHAGLEPLEIFLSANGVDGVVIDDEQDFQSFLENNHQYWDYVDQELLDRMRGITRVKFYVTDDDEGHKQLERYTHGLGFEHTVTPLSDNDWAYSWQKYYKPLSIGQRLYVVPEWERDNPVPEGRSPLYLNPGLTFGTGSHASTQLCLEGVEAHTVPGKSVLDLGCGSGILSIAALCLGASRAVAVDIDPKAVDVAYENAALNGIGKDRYTVLVGDVLSNGALREALGGGYDVVVANIVADVIIGLAPMLRQVLKPGGLFICSGIIKEREQDVVNALTAADYTILETKRKGEWVAMLSRRKK